MTKHPFILETGSWVGEGKIRFSMMDEGNLSFSTHWAIPAPDAKGKVAAVQDIRVAGLAENMCNRLVFSDIAPENFKIELQNQSLGVVVGRGIINAKLIGWEFRLEQFGFEGFEFYEASKEGGAYLFHAEYATSDDFRTVIHGKIWREK
ncbi:MAG: hypothetical protein AAF443_05015 [Chlamydiota bacterium]